MAVNRKLPSLVASRHGWDTVRPPACQVEEDIHSSLTWATPASETCCLGNHPSCRGEEKTLVLASQPLLQLGHSHVTQAQQSDASPHFPASLGAGGESSKHATQAHQSDASPHFPASPAAELQPPCDPGSPTRRCLTRLPGLGPFIPHTWRPPSRLRFGETTAAVGVCCSQRARLRRAIAHAVTLPSESVGPGPRRAATPSSEEL